ncbi:MULTISPECIES: Smr/MutS family protein [unclassified Paraflavitalea]|uniref:Smr/MutS family protein n=1 Tax=unclassified Paraflavitalea TaxID=2798305 RepID=UPI003D357F6C
MFQVGDTVVVKHTNDEGEVVEIINAKMVVVQVKGVNFPVYTDQLEYPYFKRFTENKLFPPEKEKKYIDDVQVEKKPLSKKVVDGVWLTFIPVMHSDEFGDDVVDELKIHLVNRTESDYHFQYDLSYINKPGFELKNTIKAFEDFYIHDIDFETLNDSPVFSVEFALVKPIKGKADYHETHLKLKAKQVFQKIRETQEQGHATFSYRIMETYPDKQEEAEKLDVSALTKAGYKVYDASLTRQHLEPAKGVIDLHIEKLAMNYEKLNAFEALTIQLQTFEKYLDLAIVHHLPSMVVIHGVGTGKLRDEIHEALKMRREVKTFVNQYHPSYGYGATEIYFTKK